MQPGDNIPSHVSARTMHSDSGAASSFDETVGALESAVCGDDDFIRCIKKKPRRFYLGGFKPEVTPTLIENYVNRHGPTVTWVRIWRSKRNPNSVVIRLNVEDNEYAQCVSDPNFWPRGVICRPWVNRNGYGPDRRNANKYEYGRQLYGRSDVDDYNPWSPLRDQSNVD